MAAATIERAKKCKIYLNGNKAFLGKEVILNRRRIRTFDALLQEVTTLTKSTLPIRSIRTPVGGTRLSELDAVQENGNYVAVTVGGFKKMGYTELRQLVPKKTHRPFEVKPVEHNRRIIVSGRIRKIPVDVITIFVYANGQELEPAHRITLTRAMLRDWEPVLSEVGGKVRLISGAIRRLHTLEGDVVSNPSDLVNHSYYVAVGSDIGGFKRLHYGGQRPNFNNSPRRDKNNPDGSSSPQALPRKLEPIPPRPLRRKPKSQSQSNNTSTMSSPQSTSTGKSQPSQPSRNSKNKQKQKKEEDDVFHAKPVKYKRSSQKPAKQADYDKDEGGVFKAKDTNRETEGAEEVEETKETKVELPIDQVEAEEIKEEAIDDEIEIENEEKENSRHNSFQRSPSPDPARGQTSTPQTKALTPSPRNPTPKSTSRSPKPTIPTKSPRDRTPSPKARTPLPKDRTPTPKLRTPTPKDKTPMPTDKTPTPKERTLTPKDRTQSPKDKTPTPKDRTPTPKDRTPTPNGRILTPRAESVAEEETAADEEPQEADESQLSQEEAATKIQANYRGYQSRKKIQALKEERKQESEKGNVASKEGKKGDNQG